MAAITSRQHGIVKAFRAVAAGDTMRALVDGWHLLHEAASAGVAFDTIAVADTPQNAADAELIAHLNRQPHVTVAAVSSAVLNALSPVRTPTGVVALIHRRRVDVMELLSPGPALVIVAIDIQDPGNGGAIVRAAEAAGATGVIFTGDSADPWSWKALRAAMGSTFRLPVYQQRDARTVCDVMRGHGVTLIGTVARDGVPMHDEDFRDATALVFGGEGGGLPASILNLMDRRVSIPMQRPVESLNVAVATGVLVYEARRQRSTRS